MIPCWSQPALHIGHITLYAHGILLTLGALVGSLIFVGRAQTFSPSKRATLSIVLFLAPIGLLASHLTYSIFEDPSSFFQLQGISSLGGILACLLGLALFTFRHRETRWRWFDAAAYAALCGAPIARLGCFLAHDRTGIPSSSWFSVKCFDGSYYDLALFEIIFLAIGLGLVIWLGRQQWRPFEGMIFSMVAVSYGLLRLILGQLREGEERYVGLIPEQFGALILVAAGVCCWLVAKHAVRQASTPLLTKHRS